LPTVLHLKYNRGGPIFYCIQALSFFKGHRRFAWTFVALLEMANDTFEFLVIVTVFCVFFAIIFFALTKQAEMEWQDDRFEGELHG
jgi:hypothetical protein